MTCASNALDASLPLRFENSSWETDFGLSLPFVQFLLHAQGLKPSMTYNIIPSSLYLWRTFSSSLPLFSCHCHSESDPQSSLPFSYPPLQTDPQTHPVYTPPKSPSFPHSHHNHHKDQNYPLHQEQKHSYLIKNN